jgi:AraC-like DNA-binding protein
MKINNTKAGVVSFGVKTPIIKEGDDLSKIITESVLDAVEAYNVYDDAYFCKLFKEFYGVTPVQYRRKRDYTNDLK